MLRIHKTSVTIILLILFSINVQGQKKQIWNKPLYDEYPYHYGFALGFNYFSMRSINSESFFALDTIYSIETADNQAFLFLWLETFVFQMTSICVSPALGFRATQPALFS